MPHHGTYVCALCEGEFNKGRSDEEAIAEHFERDPDTPLEETDVVCDNCFVNVQAVVEGRACATPWLMRGRRYNA